MSADGQHSKWRRKIAEKFNRLSRAHERYRQTTDGSRTTTYSERERDSRSLYVIVRLSVFCRLSVTFMRPTQAIKIFDNVSMPFGTLAIC